MNKWLIFIVIIMFTTINIIAQDSLTTINSLLDQAQTALDNDNLATAQALITGANALIDDTLITNCPELQSAKALLTQATTATVVATARDLLVGARAVIDSCGVSNVGVVDNPFIIGTDNTQFLESFKTFREEDGTLLYRVPLLQFSDDGLSLIVGRVYYSTHVITYTIETGDITTTIRNTGQLSTSDGGDTIVIALGATRNRSFTIFSRADDYQTAREISIPFASEHGVFNCVALNPSGQTLISGHNRGHLVLWDVATGRELRIIQNGTADIYGVLYSPDGRLIATGDTDGIVRLWDSGSGNRVAELRGHASSVNALAFSADGTYLASAGSDRTIRIWDVATQQQIRVVQELNNPVTALAFNPEGTVLASANSTGILWDVATGTQLFQLPGHERVSNLVFSPDGLMLATDAGSSARLWRISTRVQATPTPSPEEILTGTPFSTEMENMTVSFINPEGWLTPLTDDDGGVLLGNTISAQLNASSQFRLGVSRGDISIKIGTLGPYTAMNPIDRPITFIQDIVSSSTGEQVSEGVEFKVNGRDAAYVTLQDGEIRFVFYRYQLDVSAPIFYLVQVIVHAPEVEMDTIFSTIEAIMATIRITPISSRASATSTPAP